jgi:hypothetical protein
MKRMEQIEYLKGTANVHVNPDVHDNCWTMELGFPPNFATSYYNKNIHEFLRIFHNNYKIIPETSILLLYVSTIMRNIRKDENHPYY